MESERRLHPYSIVFAFLTQIRLFVVPGILVAVGASSRANDWWEWQPWMMALIIPNAIFALVRYFTYAYRYDESELVIKSGLLFRRERHIPYSRIQNIDAVQNVLHRILNVAEVKVETGGGETAEATMSVLPVAAFRQMREHVFAQRDTARREGAAAPPPAPLLALDLRELLLCGFIENRGAVLMAAGFGVLWETGLLDRFAGGAIGGRAIGRGVIRNIARGLFTSATVSWDRVALTLAAFAALLLFLRVLSMGWAVVRLYGFRVTLVGDDARSEFGLLTRVAMTIPLRRIQVVTIREGPLHRWFRRVAVKVDTAGGRESDEGESKGREPIAPILKADALHDFVRRIVDVDLSSVTWNGPHARAFRREVKGWLFLALVISAALGYLAGWYALPLVVPMTLWAVIAARQTIRHLKWAELDDAVVFTSGWLWRRTMIVRFSKIQVASVRESPFDRRSAMAALHVDSAGSAMRMPYLGRPVADALRERLAAAAAATEFRW